MESLAGERGLEFKDEAQKAEHLKTHIILTRSFASAKLLTSKKSYAYKKRRC